MGRQLGDQRLAHVARFYQQRVLDAGHPGSVCSALPRRQVDRRRARAVGGDGRHGPDVGRQAGGPSRILAKRDRLAVTHMQLHTSTEPIGAAGNELTVTGSG